MKSAFLFAALFTAILGVPDIDDFLEIDDFRSETAAIDRPTSSNRKPLGTGTHDETTHRTPKTKALPSSIASAPTQKKRKMAVTNELNVISKVPNELSQTKSKVSANLVQDLVQATPTSITTSLDGFLGEFNKIVTTSKTSVEAYVADITAAIEEQTLSTNTAMQTLQKSTTAANKADKARIDQLGKAQRAHFTQIRLQVKEIQKSAQNDLKSITNAITKIQNHAGKSISLVSVDDAANTNIDISNQAQSLNQGMTKIKEELDKYTYSIRQARATYASTISVTNSKEKSVQVNTTRTEDTYLDAMHEKMTTRLDQITAAVQSIKAASIKAQQSMETATAKTQKVLGGN